ncbi:MAG TPA: polysaccharide biosynthesis/export family protein [Candidatus Acidoferrales bacterium]|nr:polysaccharide biosynthesis/export family protein [Candidatus Acidoferrales bacterium]
MQNFMQKLFERPLTLFSACLGAAVLLCSPASHSQAAQGDPPGTGKPALGETTEDYNRRIELLNRSLTTPLKDSESGEYRIGAHDLLEINVFEAPDLNRSLRVSAGGEISMPLLGAVQSSGLTARELEGTLEVKLRQYMKDPHVGVFVTTVESHPVSVVGAVKKPGVFQIRGTKTVLEMLSMSEGLADDAGDEVLVMRGAGLQFSPDSNRTNATPDAAPPSTAQAPSQTQPAPGAFPSPDENDTIKINLKDLLESGDPRYNVAVYPGDIVKVTRGGIVYVIGDVKKPGGFVLKSDQYMSVLKAVALAEGLNATAAKSRAKIIRTDEKTGQRTEFPIDLGKVLAGKSPDTPLKAADIVFVPNSSGKTVLYKGSEAAVATASGLIIWR